MPDQLSLLDADAAPALFRPEVLPGRLGRPSGYNLFLAIFPRPELAERVGVLGVELRRQHGLQSPCLENRHLHITLHAIAGFKHEVPLQMIDAAVAAASNLNCGSFPIIFDRAGSFQNRARPDNNAFVLRCDASSDAAVARLREALGVALRRSGLHPKPSSTPHMTLLYSGKLIPEHAINAIPWAATRFALILSHVGHTHHQWIGEWQMG